jgi:hypothetical protein
MATKRKRNWIGAATRRMKRKGTVGAFGKATTKKIAAAKKKGGLAKKRAVFAENMRRIASKHKRSSSKRSKRR